MIRKALNLSKGSVVNKCHEKMELLVSRWSIESHSSIAGWGKLHPTLKDVMVLTNLPLSGEARAIKLPEDIVKVALDEEGKEN